LVTTLSYTPGAVQDEKQVLIDFASPGIRLDTATLTATVKLTCAPFVPVTSAVMFAGSVSTVGDTTEFVIGENGKVYLAALLDRYSRYIVGWALSAVNDRHLTIKALVMTLKRRCPVIGLLHHSEQGFHRVCDRRSGLRQIAALWFYDRNALCLFSRQSLERPPRRTA
jgi:hypothetical protein